MVLGRVLWPGEICVAEWRKWSASELRAGAPDAPTRKYGAWGTRIRALKRLVKREFLDHRIQLRLCLLLFFLEIRNFFLNGLEPRLLVV
jgi:hypothetical protein